MLVQVEVIFKNGFRSIFTIETDEDLKSVIKQFNSKGKICFELLDGGIRLINLNSVIHVNVSELE